MRRYVFRIAMLTLAVLGGGSVRANDQEIAAQIIEKLQVEKQAGTLKGFSIDMQVDEGTVWLSGRVATSAQQAKALDIARRIPGVVQVVNDLEITSPPAATPAAAPKTAPTPAAPVAAQPVVAQPVAAAPAEEPAESKPAALPVTIQATSIPATPIAATPLPAPKSTASTQAKTAQNAVKQPGTEAKKSSVKPALAAQDASFKSSSGVVGSGVSEAIASTPASSPQSFVQAAQPIANVPQALPYTAVAQPINSAPAPQALSAGPAGQFAGGQPYAMIPVYAGSQSQVPLAFAPARAVNYQGGPEGVQGAPAPMYMPGSGVGIAPARYDHPQMPGYAWPSYASHPNYAAVTYPKQYSPTAWPYIGPFYPYPQVPLGWRKVTLEWDDGWWMLDFKDRRTMYNHK